MGRPRKRETNGAANGDDLPRYSARTTRDSKPVLENLSKQVGTGNLSRALNLLLVKYGPDLITEIKTGKIVFA